jgi:hypothetical protein
MRAESDWRVLLNESKENKSRIIFSGHKHRSLIDITMQSEKVDKIISAVLTSDWNAEQLMAFLDLESQRI